MSQGRIQFGLWHVGELSIAGDCKAWAARRGILAIFGSVSTVQKTMLGGYAGRLKS
jgi:hypothetical protein